MSRNGIGIRPLGGEDIDAVVTLDRDFSGESRNGFFAQRLGGDRDDGQLAVGAERGGSLVGFFMARLMDGEFSARERVAAIDSLAVSAAAVGSGVGSRLLGELAAAALERGCSALRTQVDWRSPALVRFFAANGFSIAPRLVLERGTEPLPEEPSASTDEEPRGDAFAAADISHSAEPGLPPVRSMSAADLDAICRIDRHSVGRERREYLARKLDEALGESGVRISLVHECDGVIGGFLMARVDYGAYGRTETTAVIDTVGVDPDRRGSGIGRRMLRQLVGNLASLQVERLRTEIDWNDFILAGFLDANGFAPSQRLALGRELAP